jgi:hypothetical protein
VPRAVRDELGGLGHCTDEYDADSEPPHWPHQLYVREAKRLVGDWVWTEHEVDGTHLRRSVGVGSYGFDSHFVSRVVERMGDAAKDTVVKEGRVDVHEPQPAPGGSYACVAERCVQRQGGGGGADPRCGGACAPLGAAIARLNPSSAASRRCTAPCRDGLSSVLLSTLLIWMSLQTRRSGSRSRSCRR